MKRFDAADEEGRNCAAEPFGVRSFNAADGEERSLAATPFTI